MALGGRVVLGKANISQVRRKVCRRRAEGTAARFAMHDRHGAVRERMQLQMGAARQGCVGVT